MTSDPNTAEVSRRKAKPMIPFDMHFQSAFRHGSSLYQSPGKLASGAYRPEHREFRARRPHAHPGWVAVQRHEVQHFHLACHGLSAVVDNCHECHLSVTLDLATVAEHLVFAVRVFSQCRRVTSMRDDTHTHVRTHTHTYTHMNSHTYMTRSPARTRTHTRTLTRTR